MNKTKLNNKNKPFIFGPDNNIHYGSDRNNFIKTRGGDDVIAGLGGNDTIYAGAGDDVIYGGSGRSQIYGGRGSDYYVYQKKHVENGAKAIVNDFTTKDNLSFSGYLPEDIAVRKNKIILEGIPAGNLIGLDKSDIVAMVENAHFS